MKYSFWLRWFDHQESRSIVVEWLEASSNHHLISVRSCSEENISKTISFCDDDSITARERAEKEKRKQKKRKGNGPRFPTQTVGRCRRKIQSADRTRLVGIRPEEPIEEPHRRRSLIGRRMAASDTRRDAPSRRSDNGADGRRWPFRRWNGPVRSMQNPIFLPALSRRIQTDPHSNPTRFPWKPIRRCFKLGVGVGVGVDRKTVPRRSPNTKGGPTTTTRQIYIERYMYIYIYKEKKRQKKINQSPTSKAP